MYALLDGNNFYVACERAFQPRLHGTPVVVLSNNDGCAISRSEEAKQWGVKMGQPYFQLRTLEERGLVALSGNFQLYGDLSRRMMRLAAQLGPQQSLYSIDECFITELQGIPHLATRARQVRAQILRGLGIPCCVGLAPTPTLAKLCNHIAKDAERKPGSYPAALAQVCDWSSLNDAQQRYLLRHTPAAAVWGIGRRLAPQLAAHGVHSAWDVAQMPLHMARQRWSTVLERTVLELRGTPCITPELAPAPPQQITHTRSFGERISTLPPLAEALSSFVSQAAARARQQGLVAGQLQVFVHTSPLHPATYWHAQLTVPLQPPTADSRTLVAAALQALQRIYRPGHALMKAGVLLLDLCPPSAVQTDWLLEPPPLQPPRLMQTLDALNQRFGPGTLQLGSSGLAPDHTAAWHLRQARRSPLYTLRYSDLPVAYA